jgi:DNA-binding GntR family transcriptional regulator
MVDAIADRNEEALKELTRRHIFQGTAEVRG